MGKGGCVIFADKKTVKGFKAIFAEARGESQNPVLETVRIRKGHEVRVANFPDEIEFALELKHKIRILGLRVLLYRFMHRGIFIEWQDTMAMSFRSGGVVSSGSSYEPLIGLTPPIYGRLLVT